MSAFEKLTQFYTQEEILKYNSWKQKRKELVKILGKKLLLLSEGALTELFNEWRELTAEQISSSDIPIIMSGLMLVSILHYFDRSFSMIKNLFGRIAKLLTFSDRDLVRVTAKVLNWFAVENSDNAVYLKKTIELAESFIQNSKNDKCFFNALCILKQVGTYSPMDIIETTTKIRDELWSRSMGSDVTMRALSVKVFCIHASALPEECWQFRDECLFKCWKFIVSKANDHVMGGLMMMRRLLRVVPYQGPPSIMFLIQSTSENLTVRVILETVEIILECVRTCPGCLAEPISRDILNYLVKQCVKFPRVTEFVVALSSLLDVVPRSVIRGDRIVSFVSSNIERYKDSGLRVLIKILKLFPATQVPVSALNDVEQTIQWLKLLHRQPRSFEGQASKLLELAKLKVKGQSAEMLVMELEVIRRFHRQLWDMPQVPLDFAKSLLDCAMEPVRIALAKVLRRFEEKVTMEMLVKMAVFDRSKRVRYCAVRQLSKASFTPQSDLIPLILADRSYRVKQAAVALVWNAAAKNPLYFQPIVTNFLNSILISDIVPSDISRMAKMCSILPEVAKYFVSDAPFLVPSLTWVCIRLLLKDKEFPEFPSGLPKKYINLNTAVHSEFAFCNAVIPFNESEPNHLRIYKIESEKHNELQMISLFDTLGVMAPSIHPFLFQVIPVFAATIREAKSDDVLVAALTALSQIMEACDASVNVNEHFPDLLPSLFQLLGNGCSDEVAIAIFKATGIMGVTQYVDSRPPTISEKMSLSAIPEIVMTSLLKLVKREPSLHVYRVIAVISGVDTEAVSPFLAKFVELFLPKITDKNRNEMLEILELMVWKCQFFMQPFLSQIESLIAHDLCSCACLDLVCQLSYCLKAAFTAVAIRIYPAIVKLISQLNPGLLKRVYKFIALAVVYQQQSFDYFLRVAEERITNGWKPPVQFVSCILRILKYGNIKLFAGRILVVCRHLSDVPSLKEHIVQLLCYLVIYAGLELDAIEACFKSEFSYQLSLLRHVMEVQPYIRGPIAFVREVKLRAKTAHLKKICDDVLLRNVNEFDNSVFLDLQEPAYNNSRDWLDEISRTVFPFSPSPAIRACSEIVFQSTRLRLELFPIAFLSCWSAASSAAQEKFSRFITCILANFSSIDPMLVTIAEVVDRAGKPLLVPYDLLAKRCASPAFALHLLLKQSEKDSNSPATIESLLTLNTSMGRHDSAKGILKQAITGMDAANAGRWSEHLGEWSRALRIYEKQEPKDQTAIVRCNGHLQRWEVLREMSEAFVDEQEDNESSLWFAKAFFHAKDFEKVQHFLALRRCPVSNDIDASIFSALCYIASERYEEAKAKIEDGFKLVIADRTVFNGSDAGKATEKLLSAHSLIELTEALNRKLAKERDVPRAWKHRLDYFCHDSSAWMKLIDIRSLLLSPEEHVDSLLMMLSTLRKERKWKLIDTCFDRFFTHVKSPKVVLAYIQAKRARGMLMEALQEASDFNSYLDGQDIEKYADLRESVDSQMHARFLRMKGTIELQFNDMDHLESARTSFKRSIEKYGYDYRAWSGLAYTCSKMITEDGTLVSETIHAFLKATELHPQSSLEYMCPMFSILFRYGDGVELGDFQDRLKSLQATTVSQIVPQLVSHICHPSAQTQTVVLSVLEWFGFTHFETVFYALNFVALGGKDERATIAKMLIQKIQLMHPMIHNDAQLFVKGMRHAAVSILEKWMSQLMCIMNLLSKGRKDDAITVIRQALDMTPETELDQSLLDSLQANINGLRTAVDGTPSQLKEALSKLRIELGVQIRKLDQIHLSKVSKQLAEKRHFALSMPGTKESTATLSRIQLIEPIFCLLRTQQHPRCVYILDESGKKWRFLLKGQEDLRVDQRIMQFFELINNLLACDRLTSWLGISIVSYAVVPLAPDAGIIGWVEGADTLHHLVTGLRSQLGVPQLFELSLMQETVGKTTETLTSLQRKELNEFIFSKTSANELKDVLWQGSPTPDAWLVRVENFTKSNALMSMAGYIVGLGDRHPSNIMVQHDTGKVVHIDLADTFEVAQFRRSFPESVPFRLTRMIVNALDCGSVEGLFRRTATAVMNVLRDHKNCLMAQLEIFVHEPVFTVLQERVGVQDPRSGIMERISMKLSGLDPVATEERPVDDQVRCLIEIAGNPDNYTRHFYGWFPFW